uniref:Protein sprouty homolog 2 n=1 Tax=Oryzias latipes TaxID=8090 RepID=A0A3P9I660_ORYLA
HEARLQNDSDGGGGRRELESTPGDTGRGQVQSVASSPDSMRSQTVLSLDQIRVTRSSNDYTDGPSAAQQRQQKSNFVPPPGSRTGEQQEIQEERSQNHRNLHSLTRHGDGDGSVSSAEELRGSSRTSMGSTSSAHRLNGQGGVEPIIRIQPKRSSKQNQDELKPLHSIHSSKCTHCGRCTCPECTRPRMLPSCWMCGRRCVCSARSAVEHWTCVCCVKALFYHCSSDDEDTCADKPFSCTQSHCCVRWTAVSLLSLFFPCLLCYFPAKGCVAVCQNCYDRGTRPGCRCENSNKMNSSSISHLVLLLVNNLFFCRCLTSMCNDGFLNSFTNSCSCWPLRCPNLLM